MKQMLLRTQLALGGSVWGGLFGVAVGAAAGTIFGLLDRDISFGLDGALVGGGLGILCGALYGLLVSLEEVRELSGAAVPTKTIHLAAEPRSIRDGHPKSAPPGSAADSHRQEPMSSALPEHPILGR